MKTITILITIICFGLTGMSPALAHEVTISDIDFKIHNSFHVQHPRTKKQMLIKPKKGRVVKIVGQNKWAFVVQIYDKGVPHKGKYHVAKKWARKALNIQAALQVARMNDVVKEATNPPIAECTTNTVEPIHNPIDDDQDDDAVLAESTPVKEEELIDPEDKEEVVLDVSGYRPGCEALAKGKAVSAQDKEKLTQCVRSIRRAVSEGARKSNGNLDRATAFKNLYSKLRPEEQRFAAMIFTAQGEAAVLVRGNPPAIQEMQAVMKVVENRKNDANRRAGSEKYNELDIVLQPLQFSMYNSNDNGWKRSLDSGVSENFNNPIDAFIGFENATFAPKPQVDQVYHYHTNYVNPDWTRSNKAMRITADGRTTRAAPAGYNEGTSSGRAQIMKSYSRVRHIFFHNLPWGNKPRTPWRS